MPYVWNKNLNRYRDTTTGRFISRADVLRLSDLSNEFSDNIASALAIQAARGELSAEDFQDQFIESLKREAIRQFTLGRGGIEQMQPRDWGSVGNFLRNQYRYLRGFTADIADGNLTEGQIRVRGQMYFSSARSMYWRGYASAYGIRLPVYPGDGNTECKSNCKCIWDIRRLAGSGNFDCYYKLTARESCVDCIERRRLYSPYRIRGYKGENT